MNKKLDYEALVQIWGVYPLINPSTTLCTSECFHHFRGLFRKPRCIFLPAL